MSALADAAVFAQDPLARPPLTAGITAAAIAIAGEDPTTPLHDDRTTLARLVLASPRVAQERFAWAVSTNPTVVGKWVAGDRDGAIGDFPFVISTVWNALAQ